MPESGGIFRLFNHGSTSLVVQQGADLESFPSDHVPLAATESEGQVYALGDSVGSDENVPTRSLALFEVPATGPPVVAQQGDADDGGDFVGSMGCLEGQPRWVEEIYESEDSAASTEVLVGLDADGERVVMPITADGPRTLEAAIGQEQNDGQITCGVRTAPFDGDIFDACLDGAIQRIDLESGEVTVVLDASGLAESPNGCVDAYVSEDGFVALATDYESDDLTLGIYDSDGVEVERQVFEGLGSEALNGDEALYDFVAVKHPPLR